MDLEVVDADYRFSNVVREIIGVCGAALTLGLLCFLALLLGRSCAVLLVWSGCYVCLSLFALSVSIVSATPGIPRILLFSNAALVIILRLVFTFVYLGFNPVAYDASTMWNLLILFGGGLVLQTVFSFAPTLTGFSRESGATYCALQRRDRLAIAGLSWCQIIIFYCTYFICGTIASQHDAAPEALQGASLLVLKVYFKVVTPILSKISGVLEKYGHNSEVKFTHCGRMVMYIFYFTFYRRLFEEAKGWVAIAQLLLIQATGEVFTFVVRILPAWFRWYHWLMSKGPFRCLYGDRDRDVSAAYSRQVQRRSVEQGDRMLLAVLSLVHYAGVQTLLCYSGIDINDNGHSFQSSYASKMQLLSASLLAELVTHSAIIAFNSRFLAQRPFLNPWYEFIGKPTHRLWIVSWFAHVASGLSIRLVFVSYDRACS